MIRPWRILLTLALLIGTGTAASGYVFLGSKWSSSRVVMYLQLGSSGGALIDGSPSWDASAENALAIWNQYLLNLQFMVVTDSTVPPADGDDRNNVFFDTEFYGDSFSDAVAITTEWTRNNGQRRIEADTVFNSNLDWNSYRGPLKRASGGGTLYDLRRVALHEFGHTLGLDHPDENGQNVNAIMNSRVSNVDDLLPDDILGGQALYGARVSDTRASFSKPTASSVRVRTASYLFRGHADIGQVAAVYLQSSRLGARKFYKATGLQTWHRSIPLRVGTNTVRLYIRTLSGSRVKVTQRSVTRVAD